MAKPTKQDTATNALHKALARFTDAHGGNLLISGPIVIVRGHRALNFDVIISCTGRPPEKKDTRC